MQPCLDKIFEDNDINVQDVLTLNKYVKDKTNDKCVLLKEYRGIEHDGIFLDILNNEECLQKIELNEKCKKIINIAIDNNTDIFINYRWYNGINTKTKRFLWQIKEDKLSGNIMKEEIDYINKSQYRLKVMKTLDGNVKIPSKIANDT